VKYRADPAKKIPDNRLSGITDRIMVEAMGQIRVIKVNLDIAHQFIGDLHVVLIAPNGNRVVLHDRVGSNNTKLQTTYLTENLPELATLLETAVQGEWKLYVSDRSKFDTGMLNSWGLEFEILHIDHAHSSASDVSIVIPDGSATGIAQSLKLPTGTAIREINVFVDITHPAIGDLRVSLIPPSGIPITLHDQLGGTNDNLIYTWRSADNPLLRSVRGMDSGGDWTLFVTDLTAGNAGKLNRWKVEVMG
jgi:subtilisin-like proprotein convertase family protein